MRLRAWLPLGGALIFMALYVGTSREGGREGGWEGGREGVTESRGRRVIRKRGRAARKDDTEGKMEGHGRREGVIWKEEMEG